MTNIWIFSSGSKDGWWSGAKKILERIQWWDISGIENVAIVSNHGEWWPYKIVEEYKGRFKDLWIWLNFHHLDNFPKRWEDWNFSNSDETLIREIGLGIMRDYNLDYILLSGWIKHILWLPMKKVINIHPGPTQQPYGGEGMYGHHVHKKVWEDYQAWKIHRTCVTIHYVTDQIDRGPIICQLPVELDDCNSADDVAKKVNKAEHLWQWEITKMLIDGDIYLGQEEVVHYPDDFQYQWEISLV